MKTTDFARRAALTSVAGAVLVTLAAGPAMAGHGYGMKQHPLRGDFPTANSKTESVAPAQGAAAVSARSVVRRDRAVNPGDWLRGDFPRAEPVQITREVVDDVELK